MVVIPTVDRPGLLKNLILSFLEQSTLPSLVVVVDASQQSSLGKIEGVNLEVVMSPIRSAAYQRNLGIGKILDSELSFDFCFFLDDDVEIPEKYFERLLETLRETNVAGVSGIAVGDNESFPTNSWLNRIIGVAGKPGIITTAAINIPVRSTGTRHKVEWLIGCSGWQIDVIRKFRFEADFLGQSIFEDVLFSVRASRLGDLFVDSRVLLKHHLEKQGRPDRELHFQQWIRNRYRLRKISPSKFSLFKFWLANLAFAFKTIVVERDLKALKGIIKGSFMVVMSR